MGLFMWIVLIVVVLILLLYIRTLFVTGTKEIPFIGLSPLIGNFKKSKKYLSSLVYDSDDEEPVKKSKVKVVEVSPSKDHITIPDRWDFRDIKGDKKRERITRRVLETLYSSPFPTVRPKWIVNPKTGRNLEIDCYNEALGLCVEVSGSQHYIQSERFHKSRADFLSQVYRDKVKKEAVLARGLDFMVVPYTVPTDEIPMYVMGMLRKLGRVG